MSKYSISDNEKLVKNSNKDNKKNIVNTIKEILREDDTLDLKLIKIKNINKNFFKFNTKCCKNDNVNFDPSIDVDILLESEETAP